ncbi:amidase [Vineibacter terrae]|uniref:Amidase n=1 Tax=Vineibacter terrae TaxID=2586908 RepID=A0A5C8PP03_9HYPH|nr:amidase [Vineibacter terrae]TXL76421.1 amidase [Vineibacter terrae]
MADPSELGIAALTAAFTKGSLDPVAATESCLARIAAQDAHLRSFITVAAEGARREAERSRRRWAAGTPLGPLDGVPLAVKDNIDAAGLPCTAGTAAFATHMPAADAPVVACLRRAGAVLLGKLNMHEGALGATTDNAVYGRCMNPLKPGYTPGGSSGGSAAAVAARLCAAALGTDTMGSVRVPAAYCGVYGFKPTNGAIATDGVVPLSTTLDCVGPLARSAADLAVVARALLVDMPRTFIAMPAHDTLAGVRVGVPRQLEEIDLCVAVGAGFAGVLDRLRAAGAIVVPVDLPAWQPGPARRAGLLVCEAEAADYYGARLGPGLAGVSDTFASMLRYAERAGLSRVVAAYRTIEQVRAACFRAFAAVDALVLPTTPQPSFPHGAAAPASQADCTALANFARAPAVSLPIAADPLPVGVQLMAAPGDDLRLLALASLVDRAVEPLRAAAATRSEADASP